jgi:aspartate kinase
MDSTGEASGGCVVLKFGGTSVAGPTRVRRAAERVRAHVRRGRRVVVVVSAAGRTTDRILAQLARAVPAHVGADGAVGYAREADRALGTGEDRSAALLAAALWRLGVPASSLRAGEAGIRGAGEHGAGCIVGVTAEPLRALLDAGVVPVVAGYQAVRADGETVTLGRGGSDTTAVAVAAALGASCDIVTDVAAVHDRDPRVDAEARAYRELDHAALVRLTEAGARVVSVAAARLAAAAGVPLRVYHFTAPLHGAGTFIGRAAPAPALGGAA